MGWLDHVRICDASSFGAGGIIIGELSPCRPTVFRLQWPPDVTESVGSKSEGHPDKLGPQTGGIAPSMANDRTRMQILNQKTSHTVQ